MLGNNEPDFTNVLHKMLIFWLQFPIIFFCQPAPCLTYIANSLHRLTHTPFSQLGHNLFLQATTLHRSKNTAIVCECIVARPPGLSRKFDLCSFEPCGKRREHKENQYHLKETTVKIKWCNHM